MRFIAKITCLILIACFAATTANATTATSKVDSTGCVMHTPSEQARINRDIYQYLFIPKGQILTGATFSYAQLDSEDSQFLMMVDGLQAACTVMSISPFVALSYAKNRVFGARFSYQMLEGTIDDASFLVGNNEDYSFSLNNVHFLQQSYSSALLHRSYVGLDARGRFALFNETRVEFAFGQGQFRSGSETLKYHTKNRQLNISFHPGLSVCILNNLSIDASVGIGGVRLSDSRVFDGDELLGERTALNTHFRLNLLDISLGITLLL